MSKNKSRVNKTHNNLSHPETNQELKKKCHSEVICHILVQKSHTYAFSVSLSYVQQYTHFFLQLESLIHTSPGFDLENSSLQNMHEVFPSFFVSISGADFFILLHIFQTVASSNEQVVYLNPKFSYLYLLPP
jgi:hypothetical protein